MIFVFLFVFPSRDDGPLPEGMEVVGSSLTVQGPVGLQHAGLYECFVSYYHVQATLQFNITVKPHVTQLGRRNFLHIFLKHFHECVLNFFA